MKRKWNVIFNNRTFKHMCVALVLIAPIYIYFYIHHSNSPAFEFLINFFPEFIGMTITLIFIDSLFRLSKTNEDIRSLAWDVLHRADYIVWVWQGGARVYDYAELIYLLNNIQEDDLLALETQNLILSFGNETANMLNSKNKLIESNQKFACALREFSKLSKIRDNGKEKSVHEIANALRNGIESIALLLKANYSSNGDFSHLQKDCSKESQTWRHTGVGKDLLRRRVEDGGLY